MLSSLFLAAALSQVSPVPKPFTHEATLGGISEYRLPNGLKVVFVPDASKPTTTVNLTVFVGSRHEGYGEKGMAHLFEHMLFKETKKFKDLKAVLTELGGNANGTTSYDRTNYYETFPSSDENLKKVLEMEAERLRSAVISREKLASEMTVVRNEFEMGENTPDAVLQERLMAIAFTWHNYGDTTIGARSDIEKVPTERLVQRYEQYYQPDNAMLIIAGKFDELKTLKLIADTFGKLKKPSRVLVQTYTEEPVQDGERAVTIRRVGGVPIVIAGYHTAASTDPDSPPLDVLANILGDTPAGRLHADLVDTKKAVEVGCSNQSLKEAGFMYCAAKLNAKDPSGPARDTLLATVEKFTKKPATSEEVDRAKQQALKSYELLMNNSAELGIVLSEFASMGDWRLIFLYQDRLRAVTADDVNRVAAKYLKPANRSMGEYVPTEAPDRTNVPAAPDIAPMLKSYTPSAAFSQGEAFDASPENIEKRLLRSSLTNGMKLALLPKKTRNQTVNGVCDFKYGTEASLTGTKALPELLVRMLTRGTSKHTRQQYEDALDSMNAATSFHRSMQGVQLSFEVRRPNVVKTLELLTEALREPRLDTTEFEKLRREMIAELEQQKSDPMALGSIALSRLLNQLPKDHPFETRTLEETLAFVTTVKLEDVKAFHKKFFGAQNGRCTIVGDFDDKEMTATLQKSFGEWKATQPFERILTPFKENDARTVSVSIPDKEMAFFGSGTTFQMKDDNPEYPALMMADFMLGGGFLNGRIPARLREKEGLSYGAGTHIGAGRFSDKGVLSGYAIYAPSNVDKVTKGFQEEVEKAVKSGFSDDELKQAKTAIMQSRMQARADDGVLMQNINDLLDLGRTMAFEGEIDSRIKGLTKAQVNQTLQKYIDPKRFSVTTAGTFKTVEAPK